MHENAKKKITGQIQTALKQCVITDSWPEFDSFEKHVNALSDEMLKHKRQWLTISDVYSIFYDLVSEAVRPNPSDEKTLSGQLWALLGEQGGIDLTNKLVDYFVSIPRGYDIFTPFPARSVEVKPVDLSENLSIVLFENEEDLPDGYARGLLSLSGRKLKQKKAYFRYRTIGYAGQSIQSQTLREALRMFKIAFQQGVAKTLFTKVKRQEPGLSFFSSQYTIDKAKVVSIDRDREPKKTLTTELALDVSKFVNSLDLNTSDKAVMAGIEGNYLGEVIKTFLGLPAILMNNPEPEAERIRSAVEWCFDSYATEDETMAFLQVCFGLEALFGDESGNESLTSTLADRCAYLVGSDIKDRNSIRGRFKDLYRIRSKLVHGTTTWLNADERFFLRWGRGVLELAIFKEIRMLRMEN